MIPVEWHAIEAEEGTYLWEAKDAQVEWCRENRLLAIGGPLLGLVGWALVAVLAVLGATAALGRRVHGSR